MSFREVDPTLGGRLTELERQVRSLLARVGALEARAGTAWPDDPGWELVQVGTDIQYLYVPTGTYGPVIGSQ
jgi:hypothetical protein